MSVMKRIFFIAVCCLSTLGLRAQEKRPIVVEESPTIFNTTFDPYYNYADQGRANYINNSQFYNKDNIISNPFPASNGYYFQPGNSNPINQNMNQAEPLPSGTIYNGYIPVREYNASPRRR